MSMPLARTRLMSESAGPAGQAWLAVAEAGKHVPDSLTRNTPNAATTATMTNKVSRPFVIGSPVVTGR
jgi:hypothetical protein